MLNVVLNVFLYQYGGSTGSLFAINEILERRISMDEILGEIDDPECTQIIKDG
jgi:hypothetical protein